MKKTYITKELRFESEGDVSYGDRFLLAPDDEPFVQDTAAAILDDALWYVPKKAYAWLEEVICKQEADAEFICENDEPMRDLCEIHCKWTGEKLILQVKHAEPRFQVFVSYSLKQSQEDELLFVPVAKWFRTFKDGGNEERLLCDSLFVSYAQALRWSEDFLQNDVKELCYRRIDIFAFTKKELEESRWYRIEQRILKECGGYSKRFKKHFQKNGERMLIELIGKDTFEQWIQQ